MGICQTPLPPRWEKSQIWTIFSRRLPEVMNYKLHICSVQLYQDKRPPLVRFYCIRYQEVQHRKDKLLPNWLQLHFLFSIFLIYLIYFTIQYIFYISLHKISRGAAQERPMTPQFASTALFILYFFLYI